jgi:hypothetical protein
MCKLLGTRSMSREECCHLIMSLLLVHSSHKTFNIHLDPGAQFNKIVNEDNIVQNNDEGDPSGDNEEGNGSESEDGETKTKKVTLTKIVDQRKCLTIIEAYGRRLDCDGLWPNTE